MSLAIGLIASGMRFAAAGQVAGIAPTSWAAMLVDGVSDVRLRETVRALVALGPRMGGTQSGRDAADHVAARFRELGLSPRAFDDPPIPAFDVDDWVVRVQEDPLPSAWPYTFASAIQPARTAPLAVLPTAGTLRPDELGGRVVYLDRWSSARYGELLGMSPRPIAVLTRGADDGQRDPDVAAIDVVPVLSKADGGGPTVGTASPIPVFGIGARDGERVLAAIKAGQAATVGLTSRVQRGAPRTVVATLPGRSETYYLITAHADSDAGGPGADDNASGVAVVLELARVLKAAADAGYRLPFALRFVTWGAEYESARAYIAREGARLEGCLGVINIDQAGIGAEREAVYAEGNDVPWNEPLLRIMEAIGRARTGTSGLWPEFVTTPTQGGTDAYAFLPRRYQGNDWTSREVPAVTVYTAAWDRPRVVQQTPGWSTNSGNDATVVVDYSRVYHSSGDTPENTTEREPQNMRRVVQLIALTLERLASSASH